MILSRISSFCCCALKCLPGTSFCLLLCSSQGLAYVCIASAQHYAATAPQVYNPERRPVRLLWKSRSIPFSFLTLSYSRQKSIRAKDLSLTPLSSIIISPKIFSILHNMPNLRWRGRGCKMLRISPTWRLERGTLCSTAAVAS
jgi:hypothetical protein